MPEQSECAKTLNALDDNYGTISPPTPHKIVGARSIYSLVSELVRWFIYLPGVTLLIPLQEIDFKVQFFCFRCLNLNKVTLQAGRP